ncbi:pepsin-like aspartyl protease [Marinicella meishanensis]|uniref:pepsin-like aspartyl protease n=1 Tax=Marinicella meishanensis TaxID=2873263 RepID=UPI001CBE47C5|nr:pepsin-like aspartyl protease [Marinicella sp. NBU2979]
MSADETAKQGLTLPINLALGLGAYTTKLYFGSEQVAVNVMLDTGSSTLAIDLEKYQPENDQHLQTTTYAQDVVYGSGGWAGPVLRSQIELDHEQNVVLNDAPFAITADSQQANFQQADGIWGLAYHHLNKAYDVSTYLQTQNPALDSTHPWPFSVADTPKGIKAFRTYLHQFPEHDITPLFTDFEDHGIVPNRFSLITHRSIEYVPQADMDLAAREQEPLNQGAFIIGGALPARPKQTLQVVHDAYYNTELLGCQLAGFDFCAAPPLDAQHVNSFFSNAIIDSGCSFLVLQKNLYAYFMDCLEQIDARFKDMTQAATTAFQQGQDYHPKALDPAQWPDLTLTFKGLDGEPVALVVPPHCYWQNHAQRPNNWMFMVMNQMPQWPDQTLCGLPLINNYHCVFDRSQQGLGVIHCLPKPS